MEVVVRRAATTWRRRGGAPHVLEGLLTALDHIDEVIRIIRESRDRPQASGRLQERFGLSEIQADAILNMRLGKLTSLEGQELRDRLAELEVIIAELRRILDSRRAQLEVVLRELDQVVERFGDARRTRILEDAQEHVAPVEDAVADEDVVITVSHQGFVKRIPMHLYRRRVASSGSPWPGWRTTRTTGWSGSSPPAPPGGSWPSPPGGHCHFLSVLDVPESSRASRGQSVYALTAGSGRTGSWPSSRGGAGGRGAGAPLPLRRGDPEADRPPEFSNPRAGGIIAAGVKEGDRILDVVLSDGRAEVMLLTREGRAIRFEEKEVSTFGRTAQGVKGIDLRGEDRVVGMILVRRDAQVLTVTEAGVGEAHPPDGVPPAEAGRTGHHRDDGLRGRGAGGGALEVLGGDEVTLITAGGEGDPGPRLGGAGAGAADPWLPTPEARLRGSGGGGDPCAGRVRRDPDSPGGIGPGWGRTGTGRGGGRRGTG
jgi:DNA gyrase subunit A